MKVENIEQASLLNSKLNRVQADIEKLHGNVQEINVGSIDSACSVFFTDANVIHSVKTIALAHLVLIEKGILKKITDLE